MTLPLSSDLLPSSSPARPLLLLPAIRSANWFGRDKPVPDWGLEAAKTPTPDYAKDAAFGDSLR